MNTVIDHFRHELPEHYQSVEEPFFQGKGLHSVATLEKLCEQYKEFAHQSQLRLQFLRSREAKRISVEKPLREHYEVETDLGTTLRTFDYIEALELYVKKVVDLYSQPK